MLIAFDMVGVLVTETKIVSQHLFDMLPESKHINKELLKRRYDEGLSAGKLTAEEFWTDIVDEKWEDFELAFLNSLSFDSEAENCLANLAERYALAVVTDLPSRWGDIILKNHGINQFFKWFIFGDSVEGNKKDGGAYQRLARLSNLAPKYIWVVDDGVKNLDRASSLGMQAIGYGKHVEPSIYKWVENFADLSLLFLRNKE
jgi:HAD superfamily hydrolase (TIGR01509 family)